jgi:hypothetical protein
MIQLTPAEPDGDFSVIWRAKKNYHGSVDICVLVLWRGQKKQQGFEVAIASSRVLKLLNPARF